MAIGLSIKFANGTAEQYEAVNQQMGVEENPPDGLVFHAAGPADDGWSVIDFWESREQFDSFFESRLGPAIVELGDRAPQGEPYIKEFPVHNTIKG